jgi:hypothetical protein
MAKTIKSKVEYQVTELVNNLNEASTSTSEQKRDYFTTRAMYNAKRLSTMVRKAKIGAMVVALTFGMVACGGSSTQQSVKDTVVAKADTVVAVADSAVLSGGAGVGETLKPVEKAAQ